MLRGALVLEGYETPPPGATLLLSAGELDAFAKDATGFVERLAGVRPALVVVCDWPERDALALVGNGLPVAVSRLDVHEAQARLGVAAAFRSGPRTSVQGTLVSVFGTGVVIAGDSRIGKSETAVGLVSCGHALVSDDVVSVTRVGGVLVGKPPRDALAGFVEVHGVGTVNVREQFGAQAFLPLARLDIILRLVGAEGCDETRREVLGVEVPVVPYRVTSGINLVPVVETLAKRRLSARGGRSFEETLLALLQRG